MSSSSSFTNRKPLTFECTDYKLTEYCSNTPRKFGKTIATAMMRWKQLSAVRKLGSSTSSSSTLADGGSPPTRQKSTVQFAGDMPAETPAVMIPYGKPVSDVACRLWNLDVDPDFTLSLPRRRRASSRSSPSDSTGTSDIEKKLGSIGEANGASDCEGGGEKPDNTVLNGSDASATEAPAENGSHFLVVDDNPINLKVSLIVSHRCPDHDH